MSDTSTGDTGKPTKQLEDDLSGVMGQLSVTAVSSDNSSSSSKNLSDMPFDVVGLIIERSDYKEQLKLRKTSKSLRALVDKQKPACKSIKVDCYTKKVEITFNNHSVIYANREYQVGFRDSGIVVRSDDFKKTALDDLSSALQNPKLQLDELSFCFRCSFQKDIKEYYNKIQKVLEPLNHQLSVKKVELHVLSPSTLLSILPCLKPGYLERIKLRLHDSLLLFEFVNWQIDSTGMDQVALLEQWKQAEELVLLDSVDRFPLEYAAHFKRFRIFEDDIEPYKFNHIKNFLSKLDNFEHCTLYFLMDSTGPDSTIGQLGEPVFRNTTEAIFHHPIPDSDYYFEIKNATGTFHLEIKKKKRGIHS
ncbi:unnamed protein product [Caenorhabditis brenneri]